MNAKKTSFTRRGLLKKGAAVAAAGAASLLTTPSIGVASAQGPAVVTRRQFIILEPTPVDKLPSGKDLVEKLPLGKKETKPWWRKLLAR